MKITENFCNYQISKNLKELGMDEECFGMYFNDGSLEYDNEVYKLPTKNDVNPGAIWITAPLLQQATQFLFFKYNLHISVNAVWNNVGYSYNYKIVNTVTNDKYEYNAFDTPNKALIKGIQEAVLLVKTK